jgi:hypothetical protein
VLRTRWDEQGCLPLDHVDVAPRHPWVIATPYFTDTTEYSDRCRDRRRTVSFDLRRPLGRRPVVEQVPVRPRRHLYRVKRGGWSSVRRASGGRFAVVYFIGGACDVFSHARVRRRGRAAELSIYSGDPNRRPGPCIAVAYSQLAVVRIPRDLVGLPIVRPRRR